MPISTDPEFLTLVFAGAAGLAVAYYVLYHVLVRLRIRALSLTRGTQCVVLSSGQNADVEFKPQKSSGAWWLTIRVKSLQQRNYRIPLPIPETGAFVKLDRETIEFGRQAFEIGMDWIRQEGNQLEIGTRSFRPLRHGHTGFVDRLGRGLEKVDWKLACAEGEMALEEISKERVFGPRAFALIATLLGCLFSWAEPFLNRGALLLDPLPAYYTAFVLACVVFFGRYLTLKKRYRKLRRQPPFLADCFWPAFGAGALALLPIQHLNVKYDGSTPHLVPAQVMTKRTVQGLSEPSYMVRVRKTDGTEAWVVEMNKDDYLAAIPGSTIVNLRLHAGAFGMEWIERATLDDIDRATAGNAPPVYEEKPPPLSQ